MKRWIATLACVAGLAMVPVTQAQQIDLSEPASIAGTAAMLAVIEGTATLADGDPQRLVISPSPRAEQLATDRLVDLLAAASPENRDQFRAMFEGGELQAIFIQVMDAWGLDSTNLGDITAAFYGILWQVAHDREAAPAEMVAIRDQLLPNLLADNRLATATAAEKENDAAYLTLLGVTILRGYFGHKERGDTVLLDQLQQSILSGLAAQGLDLSDVELTATGFSRRSP